MHDPLELAAYFCLGGIVQAFALLVRMPKIRWSRFFGSLGLGLLGFLPGRNEHHYILNMHMLFFSIAFGGFFAWMFREELLHRISELTLLQYNVCAGFLGFVSWGYPWGAAASNGGIAALIAAVFIVILAPLAIPFLCILWEGFRQGLPAAELGDRMETLFTGTSRSMIFGGIASVLILVGVLLLGALGGGYGLFMDAVSGLIKWGLPALLVLSTGIILGLLWSGTGLNYTAKMFGYLWFLIVSVAILCYNFSFGHLAYFFADSSRGAVQVQASLLAAFLNGMVFLLLTTRGFYAARMLPIWKEKKQTWHEAMLGWEAYVDLVESRFSDSPVTKPAIWMSLFCQIGILYLVHAFRWVPEYLLTNANIVLLSVMGH